MRSPASSATTSRREFLQYGTAVAALATAPLARSARIDETARAHTLASVIVDRTLDEHAAAFAAEAAQRGAAVRFIGSDIGGIWMNEIEPRWRQRPVAIAGLTGGAPLFCLELLARDYGMRVVYRIEHSRDANGGTAHSISGAEALSGWADTLASAGARWSTFAAALATTCPANLQPRADTPLLDLAQSRHGPRQPIFSWVIAPFARPLITT